MDAKLQRRVQRYGWDKAAPHYDRTWQAQLEPAHAALLRMAGATPVQQVLDVACGSGVITAAVTGRIAPDGKAIGVDLSQSMVSRTTELAVSHSVPNVTFTQMDAEDLDFTSSTFDVVVSSLGLMYCPAPETAIEEMYRVAGTGAQAVCAIWGPGSARRWAEIFPITDARVQSEVCPMFFRLGQGDTLKDALLFAGFRCMDRRSALRDGRTERGVSRYRYAGAPGWRR